MSVLRALPLSPEARRPSCPHHGRYDFGATSSERGDLVSLRLGRMRARVTPVLRTSRTVMNRIPLGGGPTGSRSHARQPRLGVGNAVSNRAAWRRTRSRAVEPSAITRKRATPRHGQPRSAAILGASRDLRSTPITVWLAFPTVALISMIANIPVSGWRPTMSIEPRSPKIAKDTSTSASQPSPRSSPSVALTVAECRSSRSRSIPSPCHRTSRSSLAPAASATATRSAQATRRDSPRSTRPITLRDTPARSARSAWRQP